MNEIDLKEGFIKIDALALAEYRQTIDEVVSAEDIKRNAIRVGRLLGVMLKEPFATKSKLSEPSPRTAAYRAWNLTTKEDFDTPENQSKWQYKTLDQIRRELVVDDPYYQEMSLYELAWDAQNETGFFGYLARNLRKYICQDAEIRQHVENAIKGASAENKISAVTPELIVGTSGLTLGAYLVQNIPVLGFVGAPVIAGVVIILYTLGIKSFCEWSDSLRTDVDEKH